MNKKNNQRFVDTEIMIEAAMLELMKRNDFKKITIKKICEKAKVNRSTFYAHFIDIYDMLEKMEKVLWAELLESFEVGDEDNSFTTNSFYGLLEHIKKHKYFYKITLETNKSFPLAEGYEQLVHIIRTRCEKAQIKTDQIHYYFVFFQAGFTNILKHWVDTDCKTSEEEVATIISHCIPHVLI